MDHPQSHLPGRLLALPSTHYYFVDNSDTGCLTSQGIALDMAHSTAAGSVEPLSFAGQRSRSLFAIEVLLLL